MGDVIVWVLRAIDKFYQWWMADAYGTNFWHYVFMAIALAICVLALVIDIRERRLRND